jgi:PsbP
VRQVDRVKINNIVKFATPKELGERVVGVEKGKDGVLDAVLLAYGDSSRTMDAEGASPAYDLEYKVESTRGNNHFLVKTSIINKQLFVFTVQCSEGRYDSVKEQMRELLDSVTVAAAEKATAS